jgi:hypothetical protein
LHYACASNGQPYCKCLCCSFLVFVQISKDSSSEEIISAPEMRNIFEMLRTMYSIPPDVKVEDFITADDSLSTTDLPSNSSVLGSIDTTEEEEVDDVGEEMKKVSHREAHAAITVLQSYLLQNGISQTEMCKLHDMRFLIQPVHH